MNLCTRSLVTIEKQTLTWASNNMAYDPVSGDAIQKQLIPL